MTTATADETGLKASCARELLMEAWQDVAPAVPSKHSRPIITNVMLHASPDGAAMLLATDLEVGIRRRVSGFEVGHGGDVILPAAKVSQMIKTGRAGEVIRFEAGAGKLRILGQDSVITVPSQDPALFPDVPGFGDEPGYRIAGGELKRAIARTAFVADPDETKWAVGGVLFEFSEGSITLAAASTSRFAFIDASTQGELPRKPEGQVIVPARALGILSKLIEDEESPVEVAVEDGRNIRFRVGDSELWSRLVEGRFPAYRRALPSGRHSAARVLSGDLSKAVQRAAITVSAETNSVECTFEPGRITVSSRAADAGDSVIGLASEYDGPTVAVIVSHDNLMSALRAVGPEDELSIEVIDDKSPLVIRGEHGYTFIAASMERK